MCACVFLSLSDYPPIIRVYTYYNNNITSTIHFRACVIAFKFKLKATRVYANTRPKRIFYGIRRPTIPRLKIYGLVYR